MNFLVNLCMIAVLAYAPHLRAEECDGIVFKSKKLPNECIRESQCGPRTIFIPRSQGSNFARYIAGWKEYLPGCDNRAWGNVSFALEYNHSLKGERLAQYLFGSTKLTFTGSEVINRGERDLLADNFGLPTNFIGAISFKPRIDNIVLDFNYHLGLDSWFDGLYLRINAPIVITRWDLGVRCKEVNNISSQDAPVFPPCYMSMSAVPTERSIREALSGEFFSAIENPDTAEVNTDVDTVFGDMKQPLMFGRFACGREKKVGISNIDLILGWNFIENESSHAGIFLLTVIPTGNRPHSEIIFEPIVGNGNIWEIGPGVSGHIDLMRRGEHVFALYFEGALTHQFKRFQIRSFDLVGHGALSRYMLLKEFVQDSNGNLTYAGNLYNAIDFSTRAVRVGGCAKFDAAIKASYYYGNWGVDAGYNVYARSKEKLRIQDDLYPSDLNSRLLGVKGTEGVCYTIFNNGVSTGVTGVLNSTQNGATIYSGAPVDNPQGILLPAGEVARTWDSKTAFQSNPPVLLDVDTALDITSGAVPRQLTHKFFAHIGYTALNRCWEPNLV